MIQDRDTDLGHGQQDRDRWTEQAQMPYLSLQPCQLQQQRHMQQQQQQEISSGLPKQGGEHSSKRAKGKEGAASVASGSSYYPSLLK